MWKKIGFGILFVAACFATMYTLIIFNENNLYVGIAAVVLLVTAFMFFNAIFIDKVKKLIPQMEGDEFPSRSNGDVPAEFLKYLKETEKTQKEMLEVLKNQNALLQNEIDNLAHEIYLLSEKQVNQAKSIIKFNKENARQLAINERETLEYVMTELKDAIENSGGRPIKEAEEEGAIPEMPEDVDLSALFDIPELSEESEEEILAIEEPAVEEKEEDPFAGLSSSDPNAMMTPEDIAKLLEAMGQ